MPEPAAPGNVTAVGEVTAMFDRIAPIYDAMNALMTLGLDRRWRSAAADAAGLGLGMRAVDVACGTGALTRQLARRVGMGGSVDGVDLSTSMLRAASRRPVSRGATAPTYRRGDALAIPFSDGTADATTIAFGLRNVTDYRAVIAEMRRVTRPGGRVVVLEIATPSSRAGRLVATTWFDRIVPLLGRLAGAGPAYRYLPASVRGYPGPDAVATLMGDTGLVDVTWRPLALGMVTLHVGRRPEGNGRRHADPSGMGPAVASDARSAGD